MVNVFIGLIAVEVEPSSNNQLYVKGPVPVEVLVNVTLYLHATVYVKLATTLQGFMTVIGMQVVAVHTSPLELTLVTVKQTM